MGYFGGLGAGKGWLQYQFLITPAELRTVLAATSCLLIINNGRVPLDYSGTSLDDYCAGYEKAFAASDAERCPSNLHMGLLLPGTAYRWEPIVAGRAKYQGFKRIDLSEPVANLAPASVLWMGDTLSLNVMGTNAVWIGLIASFPRVVSYSQEQHAQVRDTGACANAALYETIVASVNSITRAAVFVTSAGERRTRMRVSEAAKRAFGGHAALQQQGLAFK